MSPTVAQPITDPTSVPSQLQKRTVLRALTEKLAERLASAEHVAAMARDEVSSGETKQEGKYDTRATEASYLARGQAWRVVELRRLLEWCEQFGPDATQEPTEVTIGTLVRVHRASRSSDQIEVYFLAPIGGPKLDIDGTTILVISPASPLGGAMTGLEAGDGFEFRTPRGVADCEVLQIW